MTERKDGEDNKTQWIHLAEEGQEYLDYISEGPHGF